MSFLSQAVSGKIKAPHLILLFGPPGIGKTSFGAAAPKPFFICSERGTDNMNVTRFNPKSIDDVHGVLRELASTGGAGGKFKTIVIDSLDWLEPLVWAKVCRLNGRSWSDIEAPGYGKGYIAAASYWRDELLPDVAKCRDAGLNIIVIAHTKTKTQNDLQHNESYGRYELKLDDRASAIWKEFVDCILYATMRVSLVRDSGAKKAKAYGDGGRVIYTEQRPWVDAKNRQNLPFELDLSWDAFEAACNANERTAAQFKEAIAGMLPLVKDEETRKKVNASLEKVKDNAIELARIENKLKTLIGD